MSPSTPVGYIIQFQASEGTPLDGSTIIIPYNNKDPMNFSTQITGTSARQAKKRPNLPKVRSGCATCKRRRIKCDERKPECNRCLVFGSPCEGYGVRISINRRKPDPKPLLPRTGNVSPLSLSPQSSYSSQSSPLSSPSIRLPFRDESEERYFRTYLTKTSISVTWSRSRVFSSSLWDRIIMQAAHDESYVREMLVAIGSFTESKDVQLRGFADEAGQMRIFAIKRYGLALRSMSVGLSKLETGEGTRKALIGCLLVCCFEWLLGNSITALRHAASGIRILRQWLRSYRRNYYKAGLCSPNCGMVEDELVQAFLRLDKQVAIFGEPITKEEHKEIIDESNETVQDMPSIFSDVNEARLYLELIERRTIHFGYLAGGDFPTERANSSTSIILAKNVLREDRESEVMYMKTLKDEMPQVLEKWKLAFDMFYSSIPPSDKEQIVGAKTLVAHYAAMSVVMTIAPGFTPQDCEKQILGYQNVLALCEELLEELKDQRQHGNFKFDQGVIMPLHIVARWCPDRTIRKRAIDLLRLYKSSDGEPMREGVWDSEAFAEWNECTLENKHGSGWGDGSEKFGDGHMRNAAKDKNRIFKLSGPANWERGERPPSSTGSDQSSEMGRRCVELGDAECWMEDLPVRTSL
ncbi:hypothetical protein NHQ30_010046 [Ciborinia camelliae]|nr:hypothetical protein NHQ30_010046 [Ciborinia camelliae]